MLFIKRLFYFFTFFLLLIDSSLMLPKGSSDALAQKSIFKSTLLTQSHHLDFTERMLAFQALVNPHHLDLRAIYGGAGTDISSLLFATDAGKAFFVSHYHLFQYEDIESLSLQKHFENHELSIKSYMSTKQAFGFSFVIDVNDKHKILIGILAELHALGVDFSQVLISKVFCRENKKNYLKIHFPWQHPKANETKLRSITFFDADITAPDNYPLPLMREIKIGFDIYFQKAGVNIPSRYSSFIPILYKSMISGGYFITDDYSYPLPKPQSTFRKGSDSKNGGYGKQSDEAWPSCKKIPLPITAQLRQCLLDRPICYNQPTASYHAKHPDAHYGWDLAVRQKSALQIEQAI